MNFVVSKVITIPDIKIPFEDLKHPQKAYSIERAMNLYINLNHEQYIGAWFMQPFKDHLDGLDGQFLPKCAIISKYLLSKVSSSMRRHLFHLTK